MSNPYWNFVTKLSRLTLARAEAVNALFEGIANGFNLIPDITAVNRGALNFAIDTGLANELSISVNPSITAYAEGDTYTVRKNGANTGACTISVNGIGPVPLRTMYGQPLVVNDLLDGTVFTVSYSNGVFRIQGFTNTGISNVEANKTAAQLAASQAAASAAASASSASSAASASAAAQIARTQAQQAAATAQAIAGGSYTAAQIVYAPGDGITSDTVQEAIGELNDDVQALSATVSSNQSGLLSSISGLDARVDVLEAAAGASDSDLLTYTRRAPDTTQTFSSPGVTAWSKPANLDYIEVEVWGGGGAGGGGNPGGTSSSPVTTGGSGGAGGYAMKRIKAADLAESTNITVGAGGVGSNATATGASGGTSSFGSHVSATGGAGGTAINFTSRTMGAGGVGQNGHLNIPGTAGFTSREGGNSPPYGASNSEKVLLTLIQLIYGVLGQGTPGGRDLASANDNHDGANGPAPGGGGTSGAANQTAQTGGSGGAGRVIVRAYLLS